MLTQTHVEENPKNIQYPTSPDIIEYVGSFSFRFFWTDRGMTRTRRRGIWSPRRNLDQGDRTTGELNDPIEYGSNLDFIALI